MTTTLALQTEFWQQLGRGAAAIVLYAIAGLVLIVIGFFAVDLSTEGDLRKLVREGRPNVPASSPSRISLRVNQRKSSSSPSLHSGSAQRMSSAASAVKPSINELGNGQGCEE